MATPATNNHLLTVRDLRTYFHTDDGIVKAVDGISFNIDRGETFALVGESGCGKSVTAFTIQKLIPTPPGRVHSGEIQMDGVSLLDLTEKQMRSVRGGKIGMVFQEPMSSLNPVFTCGSQIVEAIRLHQPVSAKQARILAIDMLAKVGIPAPADRFSAYPHQLSGGMRQRVMIAIALSCNPQLLIADEPTTALDVTIQAQILELMQDLQKQNDLGILLITHDLAVVAETAHRVGVMYASKMVEQASVEDLFASPQHPYTHGLFRAIPKLGESKERLETIPGSVPNPLHFPAGCKFHPRCARTRELATQANASNTTTLSTGDRVLTRCATCEPELREIQPNHLVACWECPGYASALNDASRRTDA